MRKPAEIKLGSLSRSVYGWIVRSGKAGYVLDLFTKCSNRFEADTITGILNASYENAKETSNGWNILPAQIEEALNW